MLNSLFVVIHNVLVIYLSCNVDVLVIYGLIQHLESFTNSKPHIATHIWTIGNSWLYGFLTESHSLKDIKGKGVTNLFHTRLAKIEPIWRSALIARSLRLYSIHMMSQCCVLFYLMSRQSQMTCLTCSMSVLSNVYNTLSF